MKTIKQLLVAFVATTTTTTALAGGLVTNSNQNAAFLRQMSQDGIIDISGMYFNPAGTAFLSNGWHVSFNIQNAKQSRDITTDFLLFQKNLKQPRTPHKFDGDALAPVIPSLHVSYNKDKWSVNASFSLGGGGGKCEFDQGLGSFEAAYSGALATQVPGILPTMLVPGLINAGIPATYAETLATTGQYSGYTLNSYMKGRQYYFGLSLGATYKFMDNLAGFVGLRGVYATCNYNGFVKPSVAYNIPAMAPVFPGTSGTADLANYGIDLNCDQTGFGVTPILGIDYRINKHWNIAARYEAETKLRLKNKTEADVPAMVAAQAGATLAQFADGEKVAANIPGILSAGVMYSPIDQVRLMAGWHYYFDKAAKQFNDKQKHIDKNTQEFSAGVEWDINKWVTLSGSWQNTRCGLGDAYMSDLTFNNSNNMIGVGVRVHPTKRFSIDAGYMHTFYRDRTVTTATAAGTKTDTYSRTNRVFGLGVNVDF
jgi:long-chain fatty acid transport protein